jgi:hypothetical protein
MKRRSDLRRTFPVTERGREISGRRVMTGGARMAVREGRGELGWAGSGVVWADWLPGAAQVGCVLLFYFFSFCFLFLLFLNSILDFRKS